MIEAWRERRELSDRKPFGGAVIRARSLEVSAIFKKGVAIAGVVLVGVGSALVPSCMQVLGGDLLTNSDSGKPAFTQSRHPDPSNPLNRSLRDSYYDGNNPPGPAPLIR